MLEWLQANFWVLWLVAAGGLARLRLQPSADCAGCSCRSAWIPRPPR